MEISGVVTQQQLFVHPNIVADILHDAGYGVINRGISGNVTLKKGHLLVSCSPLAAQMDGDGSYRICEACGQPEGLKSLKRCSQCKVTLYCSAKCQRTAWTNVHQYECRILQHNEIFRTISNPESTLSIRSSRTVRMLCTMLARIFKEERISLAEIVPSLFYNSSPIRPLTPLSQIYEASPSLRSILSTMTPTLNSDNYNRCVDSSDQEQCYIFSSLVWNVLSRSDSSFPIPINNKTTIIYPLVLKRFLSVPVNVQIIRNAFSIVNDEMKTIGTGIYPYAHLFNHSCVPNCCVLFHQNQLNIYALRDVYSGEELTIGYTGGSRPIENYSYLSERATQLEQSHRFRCGCVVCHQSSLFTQSYNLSFEEPICSQCFDNYQNTIKPDYIKYCQPREGSLASHTLFLFDWFEQLGVRCCESYGYSASSYQQSLIKSDLLPSSIVDLLLHPPTMEILNSINRRCRRCLFTSSSPLLVALNTSGVKQKKDQLSSLVEFRNASSSTSSEDNRPNIDAVLPFISFLPNEYHHLPPYLIPFLLCSRVCQLHNRLVDSVRQHSEAANWNEVKRLLPSTIVSLIAILGINNPTFVLELYNYACLILDHPSHDQDLTELKTLSIMLKYCRNGFSHFDPVFERLILNTEIVLSHHMNKV